MQHVAFLQAHWAALWAALPAPPPDPDLLDDTLQALLDAYREPQRHYHTLQHLHECLVLLDSVRTLAMHPDEVGLALWFHDAIYDVQGHDNEGLSAAWAVQVGRAAGLADDTLARLDALVMVTRHDAAPRTADEQLMIDIDLAILGAEPARFDAYETQVREEYAWVPTPLFTHKRREILQGFLARRPLYRTPPLAARLEASARTNLKRSIQALSASPLEH